MDEMHARSTMAVVAVLFAALTVAAYGSGTGPWTTGAAGPDVIDPTPRTAEAINRLQTEEPAAAPVTTTTPTETAAVPQAPAKDPAPAKRGKVAKKSRHDQSHDQGEGNEDDHGDGHGLGNTYCQSLKGKGGPAFGHCIAAKAHELHQHGKHR